MTIDNRCVTCIINQSQKVAKAINASSALEHTLISNIENMSQTFSFTKTPPQIAADVYKKLSILAQKEDLYDEVKQHSTKKALSFIPKLQEKLQTSSDKFLTATKIAVAGNVIDLAAEVEFDLGDELEKIFETNFACDDTKQLQTKLTHANKVVILGDNVGEHIFDALFIQTLQELYPNKEYYYFVRGVPIINDVTYKEAKEAGFDTFCTIIDSGVNTPGFDYKRASKKAQKLFDEADIIISKGMGNYESLSPSHRKNICFLLKVKCEVVANALQKEVGDIICKID
ncbi:DUF89 domain of unknown function [hydrothermal vent metagenome]|uniref:Damage-control phosphatase ARMT1-like metal-binding domain-containing protein n=1 Tax=hydrothermal vent metagenome TaxID=652676 RepID=A0A1W1D3M4_9ZZZZ